MLQNGAAGVNEAHDGGGDGAFDFAELALVSASMARLERIIVEEVVLDAGEISHEKVVKVIELAGFPVLHQEAMEAKGTAPDATEEEVGEGQVMMGAVLGMMAGEDGGGTFKAKALLEEGDDTVVAVMTLEVAVHFDFAELAQVSVGMAKKESITVEGVMMVAAAGNFVSAVGERWQDGEGFEAVPKSLEVGKLL